MTFGKTIGAATTASYGDKATTLSLTKSKLSYQPIASAPLGVACRHTSEGNVLAVACYWQPRLDLWTEQPEIVPGIRSFTLEHIFGVNAVHPRKRDEIASYRIFPPTPKPMHSDVQRAQGVTWGPNGSLLVSRNADGRIFELQPPLPGSTRWRLVRAFKLTKFLIHAIYFDFETNELYTIESKLDEMKSGEWRVVCYQYTGASFADRTEMNVVPYQTYGVTRRPGDHGLWFGADIRGPRPTGIYRESKLVVPLDVGVNGLAFLADGSAVAMFYGESSVGVTDPEGQPSERVYIPAAMFDK